MIYRHTELPKKKKKKVEGIFDNRRKANRKVVPITGSISCELTFFFKKKENNNKKKKKKHRSADQKVGASNAEHLGVSF